MARLLQFNKTSLNSAYCEMSFLEKIRERHFFLWKIEKKGGERGFRKRDS